ncbi:chromate transporter [Vallitaleaceae bacterium 9-2]
MNNHDRSLIQLFFAFLKIGLFTIGGGYAMLPLIHKEVVEKYGWATDEEIINYYAIGQSTPGIIAINTATFVGVKQKGFIGGVAATLGMVTPSWIIITLLANVINTYKTNPYVEKAFMGIRIMVLALILSAIIKMGQKVLKTFSDYFLLAMGLIFVGFIDVTPIYIIILGGILGIIIQTAKSRWKKKEDMHE